MNFKKYAPVLMIFFLTLVVFKNWFNFGLISGGDFLTNFDSNSASLIPFGWGKEINGLGGSTTAYIWLHYVINLPGFFFGKILHLNWLFIQRIAYLYPFIVASIFSSAFLVRKLFPDNKFYFFAPVVFIFNTYILMLMGGGQIFIGLSYVLVPLVLYSYISLFRVNKLMSLKKIKYSILTGLLLALQMMLDIRIAYVTMIAVSIYFLIIQFRVNGLTGLQVNFKYIVRILLNLLIYSFVIPIGIAFLIHAFWILPVILAHQNPVSQLGSAYSTTGAVKFFSFATFENSLSLLHPNWPENIFGKIYFMRPEFLLLPILAFGSLFFIKKETKEKKYILFFAILGLLGAFLAKGANEPFGEIYLWLFNYIPGFIMFRDPTKWYTLVAVSYSILIPFSIWNIYGILSSKFKSQKSKLQFKIQKFIPNLFLILISLFLILLIRPAVLGQLSGTFKPTTIPSEYIKLEKFLSSQNNFSRNLWVPALQRFGFYSNTHPAISAQAFIKETNYSQILKKLRMSETEKILQESSVKYVIIPYDSEGEIFLEDRKYDEKQYEQAIEEIQNIPWLKRIDGFGKIAVFEVPNPKDHFWSPQENLRVQYRYVNPTKYILNVENAKKGDILIFSESFDKGWIAKNSEFKIQSSEFNGRFNSFILPKNGDYLLTIYYTPQDWVNIGLVISGITLGTVLVVLIGFKLGKW